MDDQTSTGQAQASIRTMLRVLAAVLARQAMISPAAMAYHHQRYPLSSSFNSAINTVKKLKRLAAAFKGVR